MHAATRLLSTANVVGLLTVVLAFWFAIPQLLKLRRTRSTAGLSLDSLVNTSVSLTAWTVYGFACGNFWVIASSIVGIPFAALTLTLALRHGIARTRLIVPAVWCGLLVATQILDVVTGTRLIDLVLGCSILWFVAPAALKVWQSADISGLTVGTWIALLAEAALFGLYGAITHVTADLVYAATCAAGATVVLLRVPFGSRDECDDCPPLRSCVCLA